MTDTMRIECWNCAGEGRVAGTCIDGCCLEQDDPDCEFCSYVCNVCDGDGAYDAPMESDAVADTLGLPQTGVHSR